MKRGLFLAMLLLFAKLASGTACAQDFEIDTNALGEAIGLAEQWAKDNLDEDALAALSDVDREQVEKFLRDFQKQLQKDYVLDLAAMKSAAKAVLPLLDAHEATRPYAAWLRSRLDYFDVAEELRKATPPPKQGPNEPPTLA